MADPCATPGTTITAGSVTTGLTGLLQRLIDKTRPESTKRAIAILAAGTLCTCTLGLTLAVEFQAASHEGKVDPVLRDCLLGLAAFTAALAGAAYRKKEGAGDV